MFLLSPLILGERPCLKDLWLLALAMLGIAIIFGGNASTGVAALLVALASGIFYALVTLVVRLLRHSDPAASQEKICRGSADLGPLLRFSLQ